MGWLRARVCGRTMATVLELFPVRVAGESVMFVRHSDSLWQMLCRDTGKLERRVVPQDYAAAMIDAFGSSPRRRARRRFTA